MEIMPIPWAKSHKQICLENFWQERVGIISEARKSLILQGFWGDKGLFNGGEVAAGGKTHFGYVYAGLQAA